MKTKHPGLDKEVVTSQPNAINRPVEVQSSYNAVINTLHTDISRAAQASQSSSPEVSTEPVVTAIEVAETKNSAETEEIQTAAEDTVKAPIEIVKVDEAAGAALEVQERPAEAEEAPLQASEVGTKQEAAEVDIRKDDAEVDIENEAAKVDAENKAAEVDVEEEAAVVDAKEAATEVDIKKEAAEVDAKEAVADVEKAGEMDIEEKPETSVDVLAEKDDTRTKQDSTADTQEVEQLTTTDVTADTSVMEESREEPQTCPPEPSGSELPSETQEPSEIAASPAVEITDELTPHSLENGQVEDLKDENSVIVDAASETPQQTELLQKTSEESSHVEDEAQLPETSASTAEEVVQARDAAADQENIAESTEQEEESLLNGLDSATPLEKSDSTEAHGVAAQVENIEPTGPSDALPLDAHIPEEEEPEHRPSEKEIESEREGTTNAVQAEKEDTESHKVQKGEIIVSSSHAVEVALIPVSESIAEEKQQEDEDLYRGAEEIEKEPAQEKQSKPLLELTIPGVESCSLAAAIDILAYSEREWKGNTAKSTLIRKGYSEMSCSFSSLRRVRGDNYCALRATLYQVLATTTQTPAWLLEEDFTSLPEKLESQEHLIGGWAFPSECREVGEKEDAVEKLKHYLELLQKRWQAAAETESLEEKQRLCERVFQGREEEYGLLEVLKFLMLARAVELHGKMQAGEEVPVFCWLLFARDTSENPKTLLSNHLSQVGFGGGVEQVEMFLLGYALQHTIQTFRLYKMDTEEFVTHYPDDHKQDWPCVCIVTEDDRHYNVPIRKRAQHQLNHNLSALWPHLS
ncbi:uncharacterized protein LOC118798717 [Colossoma macropomum]|uniref:uncharacterized protein LOC118798717 n=1 Tax=Colossoma macropomum TaxID=42526 RepID=UPI00186546D3|nr:uncharacterized protein LOC118798717 [Colossoma macropomum]